MSQQATFTRISTQLLADIEADLASTLRANPSRHARAQFRAVQNWLSKHRPKENATNLEKVRGFLEAFYHLTALSAWPQALQTFEVTLNTPTQESLCNQLSTWGYFSTQKALYEELLAQPSLQHRPTLLTGLGNAHANLGQYGPALTCHQKSLLLARQIEDRETEEQALGNLGGLLFNLGKYEAAIAAQQKRLTLAQQRQNALGESSALTNLGLIFHTQGNYPKAIKYHQRSLEVAQQKHYSQVIGLAHDVRVLPGGDGADFGAWLNGRWRGF